MMTTMMPANEGLCSAMMITIISKKAIPSRVSSRYQHQQSNNLETVIIQTAWPQNRLAPSLSLARRVDTHPLKMVEKRTGIQKKIEGGCAVKGKIHRKKTIHFREIAKGIEICGLLYYNIKYYYYVYIRFYDCSLQWKYIRFLLRILKNVNHHRRIGSGSVKK